MPLHLIINSCRYHLLLAVTIVVGAEESPLRVGESLLLLREPRSGRDHNLWDLFYMSLYGQLPGTDSLTIVLGHQNRMICC